MSVLLFDKLIKGVRIDPPALSELKKKSRSVSRTVNQPQSRVVKCDFDSSAAGYLNIAVISITDRLFTERRKWFEVDSGYNDYAFWILLLSKTSQKSPTEQNKENIPSNNDYNNSSNSVDNNSSNSNNNNNNNNSSNCNNNNNNDNNNNSSNCYNNDNNNNSSNSDNNNNNNNNRSVFSDNETSEMEL
jgi:hypothetical protein